MEPYTRIVAEVCYYDNAIKRFEIVENAWDLNGEDLGEMFRSLMAAMGYAEKTIAEVFNDDSDMYEEAKECGYNGADSSSGFGYECPEDNAHVSDTLRTIFAKDDPCNDCEEECADTACLHNVLADWPEDWHEGDGDNE